MRKFGYFKVIQIIEDFKLIFILYNNLGIIVYLNI